MIFFKPPPYPKPLTISDDCKDLIRKLLTKNPNDRLGHENDAMDIKAHPWFKNFDWENLLKKTNKVIKLLKYDVNSFISCCKYS